ncbi:uncharacterized protein LOC116255146 isoform X2 [Nymphaea colorata]|uniref:uncharacterized protein LOC116255146 isoform X2 n=1 Tax=Nymphaea colorata TaxID=210225 RepID=UPI00129D4F58|nr:uncharacterized protein LOC116255146 isoform X2 [Nymphaea colorata]
MNHRVMRFSGKARQRSLAGKEKENAAQDTALVKDPSVSGSIGQRKKHPLGESKHTNIIGAVTVEKISKPLAKRHSAKLKVVGPILKVERHADGLTGKLLEETPGCMKPTIKSGRVSTNSGRILFDAAKSTQSRSISFEDQLEGNLAQKRNINRDNMHSPAKLHSSLRCSPSLSTEKHNRNMEHDFQTSEYWISQIHMAEFAGKHFVAFEFFRLALECKAKPFESLFDELQGYADRHVYLLAETAWQALFLTYGSSISEIKCVGLNSPFLRAGNHHGSEDTKCLAVECYSCISSSDSQDADFEEYKYKDSIDSDEISKISAPESSSVVEHSYSHGNEKHDGYLLLADDCVKEKSATNGIEEFHNVGLEKINLPMKPDTATKHNEANARTIAYQNISSNKSKGGFSSESSLLSIIPWSVCAIQYLLVIFWMCLLLTVSFLLLDVIVTVL